MSNSIRFAVSALVFACLSACSTCERLTVRASISEQVAGDFHYRYGDTDFHGGKVGTVAVELPVALTREFMFTVGIEHRSLIETNRDRGEERGYVGFSYTPFAH